MRGSKKLGISVYVSSIIWFIIFPNIHIHSDETVMDLPCGLWVIYMIILIISQLLLPIEFWIESNLDDDHEDVIKDHHWIVLTGIFGYPLWFILKLADKYLTD